MTSSYTISSSYHDVVIPCHRHTMSSEYFTFIVTVVTWAMSQRLRHVIHVCTTLVMAYVQLRRFLDKDSPANNSQICSLDVSTRLTLLIPEFSSDSHGPRALEHCNGAMLAVPESIELCVGSPARRCSRWESELSDCSDDGVTSSLADNSSCSCGSRGFSGSTGVDFLLTFPAHTPAIEQDIIIKSQWLHHCT